MTDTDNGIENVLQEVSDQNDVMEVSTEATPALPTSTSTSVITTTSTTTTIATAIPQNTYLINTPPSTVMQPPNIHYQVPQAKPIGSYVAHQSYKFTANSLKGTILI